MTSIHKATVVQGRRNWKRGAQAYRSIYRATRRQHVTVDQKARSKSKKDKAKAKGKGQKAKKVEHKPVPPIP